MNSKEPSNGKAEPKPELVDQTAYALGESDPKMRANASRRMALDPSIRGEVEQTAALAEQLKAALQGEPLNDDYVSIRPTIESRLNELEHGSKIENQTMTKESVTKLKDSDHVPMDKGMRTRNARYPIALVLTLAVSLVVAVIVLPNNSGDQASQEDIATNFQEDDDSTVGASLPAHEFNSSTQSDSTGFPVLVETQVIDNSESITLREPTSSQSSPLDSVQLADGRQNSPMTRPITPNIQLYSEARDGVSTVQAAGTPTPQVFHIAPSSTATRSVPDGGTVLLGGIRRDTNGNSNRWEFDRYSVDEYGRDELRQFGLATGGEQYELPPENPFIPVVSLQALSTFAVDVDTASYANIRRFLNSGQRPPAQAVRIEEMVNYFSYNDTPPSENQPFSVHLDIASCPWAPAHRLLRVGLKGMEIPQDERPLSNLVFLIDVSGSMQSQDKLPLLKQALLMLTDGLGENDQISIVTYAGDAGLVLPSTNGSDKQRIRDAIIGLQPGGSTHGSAGIKLAYEIAQQSFIEGGVNRVLLATDGDLNVGITEDESLVDLITEEASEGVFLTVLGFGTGNLKDAKLEKIADHGNGLYAYIDSTREARKVLLEQMSASLVTIAKDVKIQLEFNPHHVREYRLIGYENRLMAAEDFRNDAKDAGEIGAGHSVVALYELVPRSAPEVDTTEQQETPQLRYQNFGDTTGVVEPEETAETATELSEHAETDEWLYVRLRYKQPDEDEAAEIGYAVSDEGTSLNRAGEDFQFAAAVAAFGMLLKNSPHSGSATFSMIEEIATGAIGEDQHGHRTEFLDLIRKANALR